MASPTSNLPVIIIGAGVAGLALAQGLHKSSIAFRLFERHSKARSSQGHRFRISASGVDTLRELMTPQLTNLYDKTAAQKHKVQPRYISTATADFPGSVPVQNAESGPVDRTWIRELLMLGIEDAISYDKSFKAFTHTDGGVDVEFEDGSQATGSLLVGADGIASAVRRQLQPGRRLLELERSATWGRTPLNEDLRTQISEDMLSWFMARDDKRESGCVIEPMIWADDVGKVSEGRLPRFEDYIYWVITHPYNGGDSLPRTEEERRGFVEKVTAEWHPRFRHIFSNGAYDACRSVPIRSSKPDLELPPIINSDRSWRRVTLLGDAAHPMSPSGGAGGDTALYGAGRLAASVVSSHRRGERFVPLDGYEREVSARAREKIMHSLDNEKRFWDAKDWTEFAEVQL